MTTQNGFLSIESKNIFSILKKWLYTEQDIVFRELISNASDAIEKRAAISGEIEAPKGRITVSLDTVGHRIVISDNGIGMTEEEVEKYINQIAFSGAAEFIDQHIQDETDTIIGHFGVGFYSAFMLADHVAIETKSFKEDTAPVRWDCSSDMAYEMKVGTRKESGTDIILYLSEDHPYLKKQETVHAIIRKYFIFLKTEIYLDAPESDPVPVNEPSPLWKQHESQIAPEDMNAYYKAFFDDVADPLFWIKFESLDIGVRGILFFRDMKNGTEELDGTIKVYNRGVYVGENIPELIPKFVNLQCGIIECDNLPLVVSRSTLRDEQEDIISLTYEALSQEVTIAVHDLFENHRDRYEKFWPNLNAFVKYGVLQDKVFASVMTRKVVFEDIYGNYKTLKEYMDDPASGHPDTVYYASDALEQAHYIGIFKKCHLNALLFDHVIDQPFMRRQELVHQGTGFVRIDSNIESLFHGSLAEEDMPKIETLTQKIHHALGERISMMELKITNLEQDSITTLIINDEKSRRMADMLEIYGMIKSTDSRLKELQSKSTYLVNLSNPIIGYVLNASDEHQSSTVMNHLFDLALMSQGTMELGDMASFISRSESILTAFAQN